MKETKQASRSGASQKVLVALRGLWEQEERLFLVLTLVIGAIVGLIVVAFILVTENLASRMYPAEGSGWRRLLIPTFGALISGILLKRYFPNARGSGIPQTKAALFLNNGIIYFRTVIGKFTCCSVSLASGVALGREGPSVHVGAGIASVMGRWLGLAPDQVRRLVPIGTAAAVASAFNTPIAAVLFTLEEILGDLHAAVLGSVVLSSATAWIVLRLLLGDEPLFHVPAYQLVHPLEFLLYALLGLIGGFVSVAFVKLLLWLRLKFREMPEKTEWIQPMCGGLLVGVLAFYLPEVLGVGYANVGLALNGQMALWMMAILVPLKILATATCYSSGNAGGIFGPSLFIGAMTGGVVGTIAHNLLPDYTGSVGAYALVGMGAAFAGIIRAPLTSVIMIFEVTRDYSIVVPVMISNLISFYISYRLQREPIYEALHHQDGIHLPRGRQDPVLLVNQATRAASEAFRAELTVEQCAIAMDAANRNAWPVVGNSGLLGVVTQERLREAVARGEGGKTLAELLPDPGEVDDLRAENFPHVHADHTLDFALRRMSYTGLKVLPVVSRSSLRELTGVLSFQDILVAYGHGGQSAVTRSPAEPERARVVPLAGLLAVVIGVILIASVLTYVYRVERRNRAEEEFQTGKELAATGREAEAVEHFRNALSVSHSFEHRLALAMLLVKIGRANEARIYLNELSRESPTSGLVNLGLARISAMAGNVAQATAYFHRAIYGTWDQDADQQRIAVRLEFARFLTDKGARSQAVTELQAALEEMPAADGASRRQAAALLMANGRTDMAAGPLRELVKRSADDPDSLRQLADAEFALGNFAAAGRAYRDAARLNPADPQAATRAKLSDQIVSLDPSIRGLSARTRYVRSQALLTHAVDAARRCDERAKLDRLIASAEQAVRRTRPASYSDGAEENVSLAVNLWDRAGEVCAVGADDDPLVYVLRKLR